MTEDLNLNFAAELAAWRQALGITQPEAADLLGLPLATLRNYEQGRFAPPHPHLVRLAMVEAGRRWDDANRVRA